MGALQNAPDESAPRAFTAWLAPASATVLILTSGVIYGLQTNRWSTAPDIQAAAGLLDDVPAKIGDWEGRDIPISERQLKIAGADGYVYREYLNRINGRKVHLMLLCGAPGPISLHPPQVCFASAGWDPQVVKTGKVQSQQGNDLGQFQIGTFTRKGTTVSQQMLTYWAWNASREWECPERPRFKFAGSPHLFKIYVSTSSPVSNVDNELDKQQAEACEDFMRLLLPALKKAGI